MTQTLSEKILSHTAGREVRAGDLVVVNVDRVMAHDSLAPQIIKIFKEDLGEERVHDPERIALFIDHVAPACNISTAEGQALLRRFAREQSIEHFYDVGQGICHQLMIEEGLVTPGTVAIGADSHSTTYGAIGAFGTGMGSTDVALAFASGKTWLKVPETIRVKARGELPERVGAKDLILYLIRRLGSEGATYQALEFHGLSHLTLASRMTICGMSVELGAKVGIVPPDATIKRRFAVPDWLAVEEGASYVSEVEMQLRDLEPHVAIPHPIDRVVPISEVGEVKVDQVLLGTCTNARLEDLEAAAEILKGRSIDPGVRMIIIPASHRVFTQASANGTMLTLLEAGATFATPGCGPCIGRHMGVLAAGEICLSTGNRNFAGRMGSPEARIYVGSPQVAAATALTGRISDPRRLD